MGVVESDGDTDDGDEELADQHTESAPDEERTTSELLNGIEGERGRAHVDEGEDQRDQEGVADGSSGLQEGSGVVENEVDTSPVLKLAFARFTRVQMNSPLLHHLQRGAQDCAADV